MRKMKCIFLFQWLMCMLTCFVVADQDSEKISLDVVKLTSEQILEGKIDIWNASPVILKQSFTIPGKISINEQKQALVVAKAPGVVANINKNIGDKVEVGEILVALESKDMAKGKATYVTAFKRHKLAVKTLAVEEALKNKKIVSEQDYWRAELAAEEALINLEVAEQQLRLLGMDTHDIARLANEELSGLCCYQIRSPLKGEIISKNVSLGALVSSDQEVFTIADLDTVWVELGVYSNNITQIKPGHKIFITTMKSNESPTIAEVAYISPVLDEHTRAGRAIAILPNEERKWSPGLFIKAEIVTDEFEVPVAVLKEAIHEIDGKTILFVSHPEGFEKREVQMGRSDERYVEIIAGVDATTPYAATNTFLLKAEDGKKDAEL